MRHRAPRQSSRFGQLRISRQRAPPAHNRRPCRLRSLRHHHSRRHNPPRQPNLLSAPSNSQQGWCRGHGRRHPAATTPAMDNCADVHLHTHGMGERGHTSPHCLLKPTTTRSGGRRLRGRASSGTLRVIVERRLAGRPGCVVGCKSGTTRNTACKGRTELFVPRCQCVPDTPRLDEQKQLLNQQTLAAESGGSKQPVRIPYAPVPWKQALEIPVNSKLNPAVVARQLTIALTCDSQEYTSAVDQLMRQ